jgi:hypothetical protein
MRAGRLWELMPQIEMKPSAMCEIIHKRYCPAYARQVCFAKKGRQASEKFAVDAMRRKY